MQPFTTVLLNRKVVLPTRSEADSLHSDGYGYWNDENLLVLDESEVLYNVERQKIVVIDEEKNQRLSFQDLLNLFNEKNPDTLTQFIVFKDIRTRGFVIRRDPSRSYFLVWERGMYRNNPPSYRIMIIKEGVPRIANDFLGVVEEAKVESLEVKLAVIDRRGEIIYYGLSEGFT